MKGQCFGSIAVVGVGAIGGWVAARLALAGRQVSVVARGATLEAIRMQGISLSEAGKTQRASVRTIGDPARESPQDVLIMAVKAPALSAAAQAVRPLVGENTRILPMLNGVPWWFTDGASLRSIDPDGGIASALPLEQVVGCVVHASCSRSASNAIEVKHADRLVLGEPGGGSSKRVSELVQLFESAGIPAEESDDVRRAIWYKLWGNATLNPLSALTRATADRLLEDAHVRALMLKGMDELATIGAAVGCPIAESGEDRMCVTARLGAFRTSMLQDVEAGRPIELEALVGAPLEIARRHGISAPALELIYSLTRQLGQSIGLV